MGVKWKNLMNTLALCRRFNTQCYVLYRAYLFPIQELNWIRRSCFMKSTRIFDLHGSIVCLCFKGSKHRCWYVETVLTGILATLMKSKLMKAYTWWPPGETPCLPSDFWEALNKEGIVNMPRATPKTHWDESKCYYTAKTLLKNVLMMLIHGTMSSRCAFDIREWLHFFSYSPWSTAHIFIWQNFLYMFI